MKVHLTVLSFLVLKHQVQITTINTKCSCSKSNFSIQPKVFEFLFLIALQVICSPQILVQLFDLHIRNLESVEHLDKHLVAGNDSLRQSRQKPLQLKDRKSSFVIEFRSTFFRALTFLDDFSLP